MPFNPLHQRLREAYTDLYASFIDPLERYCDDGERWLPLGGDGDALSSLHGAGAHFGGPLTELTLRDIRNRCRLLAATNEFAINGHENRVSFTIGPGHSYRATLKKHTAISPSPSLPVSSSPSLLSAVQSELDHFLRANHWHRRQQEIVRRRDRDGEAFLRFFTVADGTLRVRFVEPDQVATPQQRAAEPAARLGIVTDRHDIESVLGYYIDGQLVDAADIQHRKANVDGNVRRGLPLFYPVHKNLRRAEKLLRNMSVVAEIQSAIALIRRHRHGTRSALAQFAVDRADATATNPATARTTYYKHYGPGTILDTHADVEYDFPAAGLDAGAYVTVLQAELRAIASRLVMPEFMLTSDASNANYSSTMIAEGPAMRMFARLQAEQVADDLEVMGRVVGAAVDSGRLPPEALTAIDIQATPPSLAVRDHLAEAQRFRIEYLNGILSPQTWSQRSGLDYDQEQANFAAHRSHLAPRDEALGTTGERDGGIKGEIRR
ncbi:MAG: phage portal protein [Pirellulales bacterium]